VLGALADARIIYPREEGAVRAVPRSHMAADLAVVRNRTTPANSDPLSLSRSARSPRRAPSACAGRLHECAGGVGGHWWTNRASNFEAVAQDVARTAIESQHGSRSSGQIHLPRANLEQLKL